MYMYIYIHLVPDLENTASLFAGQFLNPMDLAIISSWHFFFFYKPLALNWLCNSWHSLRQAQHLRQHPSVFYSIPRHGPSKKHPAKLVQRDGQRSLCAQKSRYIGLEKHAENNDFLGTLLNEGARTDNNDDTNDDNGFNSDRGSGDNNDGCEE